MSLAKLKQVCTRCKPSSIKTYWTNIKALSRLAGLEDVPAKHDWLNDRLLKKIKSEPLNRFKRYASAGVKAAQMYKVKKPKWTDAMSVSTQRYATIRETGKRTKREDLNWPKEGYKALSTLAKDLFSEVEYLEHKKTWTTAQLYHYQKYLIVLFYSKHALRGDLADVRLKRPFGPNFLKKKGKTYELTIGEHKTARSHGSIVIQLGEELSSKLNIFLPKVRKLTTHGFLLSTLRTRNRLTRQDMLRLIRNTTKDRLGKNIGVQLIRVLKVTSAAQQIDEANKLQQEMGHSSRMQKKYISRI